MVFSQEPFTLIEAELAPLWRAHYDETAEDRDRLPFDPDYAKYRVLDAGGFLVVVTARQAGALVGYCTAAIDRHIHHRTTLFAMLDLYYLAPAHRGGRNALRLFQRMEAALAARGVVRAIGGTLLARDQSKLFTAMGWRPIEQNFVKIMEAA